MYNLEVSIDQMVQLMEGHWPPEDPKQRDAYFELFSRRMHEQLGEEVSSYNWLLGTNDIFQDWINNRPNPAFTISNEVSDED